MISEGLRRQQMTNHMNSAGLRIFCSLSGLSLMRRRLHFKTLQLAWLWICILCFYGWIQWSFRDTDWAVDESRFCFAQQGSRFEV